MHANLQNPKPPLALPPRLVELQEKVAEVLPQAHFEPIEAPTCHTALKISLQNGYQLLALPDPDMPWLLFEIDRSMQPAEEKLDFEGCLSVGHAFTEKLSGREAVDLIVKYAARTRAA
jgi:hypothetical protein